MFDKHGIAKDIINNNIFSMYMNKYKLEKDVIDLYSKYPFKIIRLNIAIKYYLPVFLYKLISKYY